MKDLGGKVELYGEITAADAREFYSRLRGAEFLFKGNTRNFVERMGYKALEAEIAISKRKRADDNLADRGQLVDREEDALKALSRELGDEQLEKVFSRYLDLSKVGL
jgi:hypothetical protein